MSLKFKAPEYQSDGSFLETSYEFIQQPDQGWLILRNNAEHLRLGPGYVPIKTSQCGVCSTDLARRFLPYELPQIIGHEVVGTHQGRPVVVEINASHAARDLHVDCPFCSGGMNTQCPDRITLGIDRLPGGFSPWFLAPVNAVREVPTGVGDAAVLTEPFAAALQAVESSAPRSGQRVAVLGPRRLGALIIAALSGYRRRENLDFEIIALARHEALRRLSTSLGADQTLDPGRNSYKEEFDLVFDTTGTPDGFARALEMSRGAVHLKSTHGQAVLGLKHITDLVVQEIALLPTPGERSSYNPLEYTWPSVFEGEPRRNYNVYVPRGMPPESLAAIQSLADTDGEIKFHRLTPAEALARLDEGGSKNAGWTSPFPGFDLALASTATEVDEILRPDPAREISLVRARGAIVVAGGKVVDESFESPLREALSRGVRIQSSRCGDFQRALELLAENSELARKLREEMITHRLPLNHIQTAFEIAADSGRSIKVVVDAPADEGRAT